jgi:general secretion pathway protein K
VNAQREAGFALLIVLWSLVLLALILTQLLSAGRSEAQLASNLRDSAEMEAIADGAVHEAMFHLLAGGAQHWPTRGVHRLKIGRGLAEVRVEDTADKINPNSASPALLRALAGLCDAPDAAASQLAQAIVTWRSDDDATGTNPAAAYRAAGLSYAPPGLPFETLDEVGLVVGMTPPLLACMRPHLSLYQAGAPGPQSEDALVARALATATREGADALSALPQGDEGLRTVTITATATLPHGGRFVRRATVRLEDTSRILDWE